MAKVQFNCRLDSATLEAINSTRDRWSEEEGRPVSQAEVIERVMRGDVAVQSDTRLDEVLEFVRSAPSEIEEACLRAISRFKSERGTAPRLTDTAPSEIERRILREEQEILGAASPFDPASIPGVSTGPPLNAYCIHCEKKFAGAKGANTCVPCGRDGHVTAGNCRRCAEVAHAKKLQASSTGVDDPSIDYESSDPV